MDELKTALINPDNYRHPFKMSDAFFGIEAIACRRVFLRPTHLKEVSHDIVLEQNDNPRVPQDRELPRNCGQLLGQLDELLPFIYIAQYGASDHDLGAHATDVATGLFAVGKQTGGDRPVAFRVGLVLPVHRCRDEKVRTTLLEIPALVKRNEELHTV